MPQKFAILQLSVRFETSRLAAANDFQNLKSKTKPPPLFVHRMGLIRGVDEEDLRRWLWACTLCEWPRGCFRRSGKFSWIPRNPRAEFSFRTLIFQSAKKKQKWKKKKGKTCYSRRTRAPCPQRQPVININSKWGRTWSNGSSSELWFSLRRMLNATSMSKRFSSISNFSCSRENGKSIRTKIINQSIKQSTVNQSINQSTYRTNKQRNSFTGEFFAGTDLTLTRGSSFKIGGVWTPKSCGIKVKKRLLAPMTWGEEVRSPAWRRPCSSLSTDIAAKICFRESFPSGILRISICDKIYSKITVR